MPGFGADLPVSLGVGGEYSPSPAGVSLVLPARWTKDHARAEEALTGKRFAPADVWQGCSAGTRALANVCAPLASPALNEGLAGGPSLHIGAATYAFNANAVACDACFLWIGAKQSGLQKLSRGAVRRRQHAVATVL